MSLAAYMASGPILKAKAIPEASKTRVALHALATAITEGTVPLQGAIKPYGVVGVGGTEVFGSWYKATRYIAKTPTPSTMELRLIAQRGGFEAHVFTALLDAVDGQWVSVHHGG